MDTSRLKMLANEIKQKSELEQSLRLASKRQLKMLPSMPKVDGIEFKSLYVPCANVSGDFYDIIRVSEHEIGIALGDVSGHGIEAGIIMGMAKKALQIYAKGESSPKQALIVTNLDLAGDLGESTFVSAAYGILNTQERIFKFARAGNNPPYLINPARAPIVKEVKPNGMVIGVDKSGKRFSVVMQEEVIQLQSGDVFFQFTDGIVEAPDGDKCEFGEERLRTLLTRSADKSLDEMVSTVEEAVRAHIGNLEQEDDITVVAFRVA